MRLFLLLPLVACNVDSLSTNGELGHLSFSLSSAWYLDPTQLTEVDIVTGHEQYIGVSLTEEGEELADGRAGALEYVVTPADGVTIGTDGSDTDSAEPRTLAITVADPGDYTVEARLRGELFDRIQLGFDTPAALEIAAYVREPWGDEFARVSAIDPVQVREGSQLAYLPIPQDDAGVRLAGDVATSIASVPTTAVVPAENVLHVNEDDVSSTGGVPSLYFIEPGDVTVTLADTVNPVEAALDFVVE